MDRISVKGYRSFKDLSLELRKINLLIGSNGAGKSNFLSLFELLGNTYEQRLGFYVIKRAHTLRCRKYRNRRLGEFLKELELSEGRATSIPTIQNRLRENGSAPASIETNDERSFFLIDISCHPDFVGDDLSQVVSQVEHVDNKDFNEKLPQVVSQVKGADLEQVIAVFISLQKAMSMAELMEKFGQVNRTRFKRTCLDILINTGLATPTVPDKPNSRFQKYVLTGKGKQLLSECTRN